MRTEVGAFEAKTKLPELLRRVEEGESFTITNRGVPVADLVPTQGKFTRPISEVIDEIIKLKESIGGTMTEEQYQSWRQRGRK